MNLLARARTYWMLGPRSVARVAQYRLALRSGLHAVQRLHAAPADAPFFRAAARQGALPKPNQRWRERTIRFDWLEEPVAPGEEPDWLANPIGCHASMAADRPWWTICEFGGGDIKGLWELSRFSWLPALAGCAAVGDADAGEQINRWLRSWASSNPPYLGPNWKCGQEAAIRVMHLLAAAVQLDEDREPLPGLISLVAQHLARIAPTMAYALGQDNNHGVSEAVALFIGGDFLARVGDARGERWSATGRHWLEEQAETLIGPDGGFSQYSVNYHRLMLDSYSLAEIWRRRHSMDTFSPLLTARLAAASEWLHTMVDQRTGDSPNIGASDGARLLPLTDSGYRDFRPSVQLAFALFQNARAYSPGEWDLPAHWLGLTIPDRDAPAPLSRSFDDSGWHVLRMNGVLAVLRYPRFRFRPSQSDLLHFDLTIDGANLLRDAGTYSYNDPDVPDGDFGSTRFHNTISFDDTDQMPRIGRFLFADWLTAEAVATVDVHPGVVTAAAGYRDRRGYRHHRTVELHEASFICTDRIGGVFGHATLRWRLPKGEWALEGRRLSGDRLRLELDVDGPLRSLRLVEGSEARLYHLREPVSVLELVVGQGATQIVSRGQF